MAYHEKTTSRDVARLMVSLGLFVFAFGTFSYLITRFGVNPMSRKNTVTLAQLFGAPQPEKSPVSEKGSVAGAETEVPHFDIEAINAEVKKDDHTLEFVRVENAALVRYKDNLYGSQVGFEPELVQLPDAGFFPWKPLINTPKDVGGIDEVYSFYSSQDTSNIAFVMRWAKNRIDEGTHYDVYVYNAFASKDAVRKVHTFIEQGESSNVPKIASLSADGRYLALALFTCGTCTTDTPVTMVIDTTTGVYKDLGKTSELTWGQGGEFQYKELQEVECPDKTSQTKCVLDPQFLEYKTGKL